MSFLETILKNKISETVNVVVPPLTPVSSPIVEIPSHEKILSLENSPLVKFLPCKIPDHLFFWQSPYDETLHCSDCSPPPTPRFARKRFTIAERAGGRLGLDEITERGDFVARWTSQEFEAMEQGADGERAADDTANATTLADSSPLVGTRGRGGGDQKFRTVDFPTGTSCHHCSSSQGVEIPIHGGRAIRLDCARCRSFVDFSKWDGADE